MSDGQMNTDDQPEMRPEGQNSENEVNVLATLPGGSRSFNGVTNNSSYLKGGVDPTSGLYSASIPIAEMTSGNLTASSGPLTLSYSPLNQDDKGLGKGWSLFDAYLLEARGTGPRALALKLPGGEIYSGVRVTQGPANENVIYPGDNQRCVTTNLAITPDTFSSVMKVQFAVSSALNFHYVLSFRDGSRLWLTALGETVSDFTKFAATYYVSPQGQLTGYTYGASGTLGSRRLVKVSGQNGASATLSYRSDGADIVVYSDSATEKQTIKLTTAGGLLTAVENTSLTPSVKWDLAYSTVSDTSDTSLIKKIYGTDSISLLSGVTGPTGSTENVLYSAKATFPGVTTAVSTSPHVTTHTRRLSAGQTEGQITARYEYARDIIASLTGEPFNPGSAYENVCLTGEGSADDHVTLNYWRYTPDNMGAEQAAYDFTLNVTDRAALADGSLSIFGLLANVDIPAAGEYPGMVKQHTEQFFPPAGGPAVLAKLATQVRTTHTTRTAGVESTRTEEHFFTYDAQGNLTRETRPDGTRVDYTYYPATGDGGNCPPDPQGQGFTTFLKEMTVTPRQTGFSTPVLSTRYFYKGVILNGHPSALLLRQEEYRDGVKLGQNELTYNESGDVTGTLAATKETVYNGGQSYVTTAAHTYSRSGRMLTVNTTVTTHDNLPLTSSVTKSIDTGLVYAETDVRGNTAASTYDRLARPLTRVTNGGTPYEVTETTTYGITRQTGTTGLPATGPAFAAWTQSESTRQPGVKTFTGTDALGRMVGTWMMDPAHNNGKWTLTQSVTSDTFGRPVSLTGTDFISGAATDPKNTQTLTYQYDNGMVTTAVDSNGITTRQEEHMVTTLAGNPQVVASTRTQTTGTTPVSLKSAIAVTYTDMNGLVLCQEMRDENDAGVLHFSTQEYDGLDRLRKSTDELGNVTTFDYDARDRVTTTTLPDGSQVNQEYAPFTVAALATSIGVTPSGKPRIALGTRTFDGMGRNTQLVSGGRTYNWTFSGTGPVPATMTTPKGDTLRYTVIPQLGDVLATVKDSTGQDISNTYTYDAKTGLMSGYSSISGRKTSHTYNPTGMMIRQTVTAPDGTSKTGTCGYSLLGRVLSTTDVTGVKTTHTYDSTGRLTGMKDSDVETTVKYDALGRAYETVSVPKSGGGTATVTTTLAYDALGQEVLRTVVRRMLNRELMRYTMTSQWRKNGQLERRILSESTTGRGLRDEQYSYDSRNRLTEYTCKGNRQPKDSQGNPVGLQLFTWDALNNLTKCTTQFAFSPILPPPVVLGNSMEYTYDIADPTRLIRLTQTTLLSIPGLGEQRVADLQYDRNGNLTTDEAGRTLTWSAVNQLKGVSQPGLLGKTDVMLDQDATGTPASRTEKFTPLLGNPTTRTRAWYYSGDGLQAEVKNDGSLSRVLGGTAQVNVSAAGTRTTRLMSVDGQASPQWSAAQDSDTAGEWADWAPFGEGGTSRPADSELYGYTGEHRDPMTGCYYLGQRQYSPALRHFTSPDSLSPFGAGGINSYGYCDGDPVNNTDPTGHYLTRQGVSSQLAYAGNNAAYRWATSNGGDWQLGLAILGLTLAVIALSILTLGAAAMIAGGVALGGAMSVGLGAAYAGVIGAALGVASVATAEDNPEISRRLGIASTVFGFISLLDLPLAVGSGIGRSIRLISRWAGQKVSRQGIQAANKAFEVAKSGRGAAGGSAGSSLNNRTTNIGDFVITHSDAGANRLLVNAHGNNYILGGRATVPQGTTFNHYARFGGTVQPRDGAGGLRVVLRGGPGSRPTSIRTSGQTTSNTTLGYYELGGGRGITYHQALTDNIASGGVDVLNVIPGQTPTLRSLFSQLEQSGLHYDTIEGVFCRESEFRNLLGLQGQTRFLPSGT